MESSSAAEAAGPPVEAPVEEGPVDLTTRAVELGLDQAGLAGAGSSEKPVKSTRGRSRWRWAVAAVLAALLAVAGFEGWLLYQQRQTKLAAAQALDAAQKYAVTLTSVDPNAIDKNFAEVLDGATGDFKHVYAESSEHLRQLLIQNKAAAHGTVVEAAVKSAGKSRVEVMLFIDQSVSNVASPQPQLDRSRVVMTMEKADGRWLASKVDMP